MSSKPVDKEHHQYLTSEPVGQEGAEQDKPRRCEEEAEVESSVIGRVPDNINFFSKKENVSVQSKLNKYLLLK